MIKEEGYRPTDTLDTSKPPQGGSAVPPVTTGLKGYRELSQAEKDLMNEITAKGAELKLLIEKAENTFKDAEGFLITPLDYENLSWLDTAKQYFQIGLMALKRAVAKPEFF